MNNAIHIIAIGSPFGDDRLGWEMARQLTEILPKTISILSLDRPGMSLLSYFNHETGVLLIDAVQSGAPPGTIHWLEGEDIPKAQQPTSSHGIGIREVFQLGKTLNILPQQLNFCGIERDPAWQSIDALSPALLKSIPLLLEQITNFIHSPACKTP
ncbi:hydrogenase maturation protease [Legionella sp. W05-934-2]|uniref:hydrogenase maturation protease n=1 Tax=Legionella sp. W05-934-2 TaxID=1198649 RepID=UPI00346358C2